MKKAEIKIQATKYSKELHYRKEVKRDRDISTTHGSLIDFSVRDFIAGVEYIISKINTKSELDIAKKADLYSQQYDSDYKDQAATDYYNGYLSASFDNINSNVNLYDYATGSINGLPAIPEKNFNRLLKDLTP